MKQRKRAWSILLVMAMMLSILSGCLARVQVDGSIDASKESTSMTLMDQIGREVVLDQPAERVVSVYYLSTALLVALGAEDTLVGIEMKADTRELYRRAAPQFLDLPAVGSGKGINVEATAALEPDLVILPKKLSDAVPQLEALDIPCIVIDPETMSGFLDTIQLVGEAVGAQERAFALSSLHLDVMESVGERCAVAQEKPIVYLAGPEFLRTSGSGMYQNDLILTAGGQNAAAEIPDDQWVDISPEQLLAWNPDRIFMVSYGEYSPEDAAQDPRFAGLEALHSSPGLLVFPSAIEPWDYPTPSSVLGIYWLAVQLHPDIIPVEEYIQVAQYFYEAFYEIQVAEEELALTSTQIG